MKYSSVGAVIVAAGLSSRMNDFKPLMKIGNRTMIETAVNNFKLFGVDKIIVVTGYRSKDIENKLKDQNIDFIYNNNFQKTHMFDSICLGLKELGESIKFAFITPGDSPYVQQYTLNRMIDTIINSDYKLIQPSYEGNNGHPILIRTEDIGLILKHNGTNGMKGAIANIGDGFINIPFVDPGIIMDADTKIEYAKLIEYNENRNYPSAEFCRKIKNYFQVSDILKSHCDKVAEVALDICKRLKNKGIILDENVIVAASMLHDIAKGNAHHEEVGANWISEMGYEEISRIVKEHMELREIPEALTEKEVVFLADKLVMEDKIVTIEQRFSHKEKLNNNNVMIENIIKKRKQQAISIYDLFVKYTR